MPDIGIFDLLTTLERRKIVTPIAANTSYCDCCGKKHFRQWYRHERTGDEFYICTPTWTGMVKYSNSGNWNQIALVDIVNHLIN